MASISVVGAPNTLHHISVYYPSGASKAAGLDPKVSDGNGRVSWEWKIGPSTTIGDHYAVVSDSDGNRLRVEFTVAESY